MTRKGLALGAAASLVVTGFSSIPANANGLADTSFVSLLPTTGTEYTVLSGTGNTFSLTANEAATVAIGNLKFLVTDTAGVIEPTAATTGRSFDLANAATLNATTAEVVTLTDSTLAAKVATGDRSHWIEALTSGAGPTTVAAAGSVVTVTDVTGSVVTFTTPTTINPAITGDAAVTDGITLEVIREARHATNGTFVVDTGSASAASNEVLVLATDGATTRSVTVKAWMDANGNDLIDSTEYTSPERTVTWKKASEVVALTTLSPIVGDTALVAKITTTPVLNGQQTLATNPVAINAAFTRSLSTSTVYADNTDTSGTTSNTSSVWNDTDKTFSVSVNTDADAANEASAADGTDAADAWDGLAAPAAPGATAISVSTTGLVTVTDAAHGLVTGDKVTVVVNANDSTITIATEATARTVTVTGSGTYTYQVSETTGFPTSTASDTSLDAGTAVTLATYSGPQGLVDRVGAETYTAQATVGGDLNGAKVSTGVASAVSSTTTIATAASPTVQGLSFSATGTNTTYVLTGTKSVPLTITVEDSDGDAVGAGRAVALSLSASGTADTFRVNGKTADTVLTDANGQVTATITATAGNAAAVVQVTATAENIATADIDLTWADAVYGLVDLAGTDGTLTAGNIARNMIKLSSYDLKLMVADQWFNVPAAGTYRLNVSGEGVVAKYVTLVDGKANVTVTDTGVFGDSVDAVVKLEKLSGTTVTSTSTFTFQSALATAYKVAVGAAGTTLYGNTVVASVAVAEKALVEIDSRTSSAATPAYANNLVLNGQVTEKASSAAKAGAVVTVSGPTNILFKNGSVAKRGSLTLFADANGKFEVTAYSTTAQKDSVITFTAADGASNTIKVSFTGTGVGEGTSLVVTTPANVKPASTFQVKAKLSDAYGNVVDTAAGRVKVTYTGPGIVFGTLPDQTDANGELQFSVLLGSNDTGNVVVTVSYDQNGDADYVDAKDLNTTKTITVGTGAAAGAGKVNVGSFNGKLVVYASGLNGKRISWKVGGNWGSAVASSNYSIFNRPTPRAGVTVSVDIYVDGVKTLTKSVVTR
jgi:hypothetical protein